MSKKKSVIYPDIFPNPVYDVRNSVFMTQKCFFDTPQDVSQIRETLTVLKFSIILRLEI
jgi:hypothetical protein